MSILADRNDTQKGASLGNTPLVYGEWSLATEFNATDDFLFKFADAQKLKYSESSGWLVCVLLPSVITPFFVAKSSKLTWLLSLRMDSSGISNSRAQILCRVNGEGRVFHPSRLDRILTALRSWLFTIQVVL
jgi:hypothetical protein